MQWKNWLLVLCLEEYALCTQHILFLLHYNKNYNAFMMMIMLFSQVNKDGEVRAEDLYMQLGITFYRKSI